MISEQLDQILAHCAWEAEIFTRWLNLPVDQKKQSQIFLSPTTLPTLDDNVGRVKSPACIDTFSKKNFHQCYLVTFHRKHYLRIRYLRICIVHQRHRDG